MNVARPARQTQKQRQRALLRLLLCRASRNRAIAQSRTIVAPRASWIAHRSSLIGHRCCCCCRACKLQPQLPLIITPLPHLLSSFRRHSSHTLPRSLRHSFPSAPLARRLEWLCKWRDNQEQE